MSKKVDIRPPRLIIPAEANAQIYIRPPRIREKPRHRGEDEFSLSEAVFNESNEKVLAEAANVVVLAVRKPGVKGRAAPVKRPVRPKARAPLGASHKAAAGSARKSRSSAKPGKSGTPQKARQAPKAAPQKTRAPVRAKKKRISPPKIHPPRVK